MVSAMKDLWYDFLDWAHYMYDCFLDQVLMWWDWHWGVYSCRPEEELRYRYRQLPHFVQTTFFHGEDDYVDWYSQPRWKMWAIKIGMPLFVLIGSISDINF